MKQIISFFFIIFIINSPLFSQFKEGYVVDYNNDTTYGYIASEGSIKNSQRCRFKPDQNSETKVYYPGDIKAFRFTDGKYFMTWEIQVDNEPQQVFLEWLLKGRASMLTYSPSDMKVRHFIMLENDSLYELKNTLKTKEIKEGVKKGGRAYQTYKKEYLGMLRYFFRDSPSILPQIDATDFDSKSFIKVAKTYHEKTCDTINCIVFEDDNRQWETHIGFAFSYFNSQLKIKNQVPEKVNMTHSPGYGVSFKFSNLPVVSSKFSMRTQITYGKFFHTYDAEGLYWGDDNRIGEYSLIRLPWQIVYNFRHAGFSPYISAGLNANYRFGFKSFNRTLMNYLTKFYDYNKGVSAFQLGLNTGVGLEYYMSPNIAASAGIEYERALRFFGTFVNDHSYLNNYIMQAVIMYKLK